MEKWQKQLRKIPPASRNRILDALMRIQKRDYRELDRLQLRGSEHFYRVRVGNYRIIYYDDGANIILKAIPRRDDHTYSDF